MCVAIAKPRGVDMPSHRVLSNCEWTNRDGMGVAWVKEGVLRIKKDFKTLAELQEWVGANITTDTPCLVHFRLATAGGVSVGMRHPFPISNDEVALRAPEAECDMALVHNGVLWSMERD